MLVIVFMSCTSVASAQLIAMSSIYAFDIYKTYINKKAQNAQIITQSHIGVVGSWLIVSSLATAFHKGGVDLNWVSSQRINPSETSSAHRDVNPRPVSVTC